MLACSRTRLLARLLACSLACLLACVRACLLACCPLVRSFVRSSRMRTYAPSRARPGPAGRARNRRQCSSSGVVTDLYYGLVLLRTFITDLYYYGLVLRTCITDLFVITDYRNMHRNCTLPLRKANSRYGARNVVRNFAVWQDAQGVHLAHAARVFAGRCN